MFGKKATAGSVTIIAKGDVVEGTLRIAGQLHVDGQIVGNVHAEGTVSIGPDGKVNGELHGADIAVAGRIDGSVRANGSLHMLPNGVVQGDAYFQTLQVDRGGLIYGHTGSLGEDAPKPKLSAKSKDETREDDAAGVKAGSKAVPAVG